MKKKINQLDEKEGALSRRLFDGGNDDETAAARDPGYLDAGLGWASCGCRRVVRLLYYRA